MSTWIILLIATNNTIAIGITSKYVACHPKLLIIVPPIATPITAPAENMELNIPWATASFSGANLSLMIPNEIANIDAPKPCIILAIIITVKFVDIAATDIPMV